MSPTILRKKGYRFYFLSNEENRIHIHVISEDGEAKFWLEPIILLALYHGALMMKSLKHGKDILVSVENITPFGIWLFVNEKEYFLSYIDYPHFKEQALTSIQNVQLLHGYHLYWPDLDVDLEIDNLENPEKYPLKFKRNTRVHIPVKSGRSTVANR
jgi:hypothetical protein